MTAMREVSELLLALRGRGLSDEQIAVGIGDHLPGNAHPSSLSVRRWRVGSHKPGRGYEAAVREYFGSMEEE